MFTTPNFVLVPGSQQQNDSLYEDYLIESQPTAYHDLTNVNVNTQQPNPTSISNSSNRLLNFELLNQSSSNIGSNETVNVQQSIQIMSSNNLSRSSNEQSTSLLNQSLNISSNETMNIQNRQSYLSQADLDRLYPPVPLRPSVNSDSPYFKFVTRKHVHFKSNFIKIWFDQTILPILHHEEQSLPDLSLSAHKMINKRLAIFYKKQGITSFKTQQQGVDNVLASLVSVYEPLYNDLAGGYLHIKEKFLDFMKRERSKDKKAIINQENDNDYNKIPMVSLPHIPANR